MKLLLTADIHIGRRSGGLGAQAEAGQDLATAGIWRRIVDLAVEEGVDIVALAGDIVDEENRFFEAFGALDEGVRRLAAGGIDVVAVAGNHDHDVFSRLARALGEEERFHFLGAGGRWEEVVIRREGGEAVAFHGWSFPTRHYTGDPMALYDLPRGEHPVVGLLHADLDQAASLYAPVSRRELGATRASLWCLGHVHRPMKDSEAGVPILYPGSPQALDPTETGVHGPWLVCLEGGAVAGLEQVPLSPVRYERVALDLKGVDPAEDLQALAGREIRAALEAAVEEGGGHLRYLSCRLEVGGRTPLHGSLGALFEKVEETSIPLGGAVAVVDGPPAIRTVPALDMEDLARGRHPGGALARLLLEIEGEERERTAGLVRDVQKRLRAVYDAGPYAGIALGEPPDLPPGEEQAREMILAAGYDLLAAMRREREGGS